MLPVYKVMPSSIRYDTLSPYTTMVPCIKWCHLQVVSGKLQSPYSTMLPVYKVVPSTTSIRYAIVSIMYHGTSV